MDSLNPDLKLTEEVRHDSINENINRESLLKSDIGKKKIEKIRKDDIKIVGINSDELVAIGTSTCGRWVKFQQRLGEGGYKTVFKAYDREKGNNVAWCEFKPHHVDSKEKQVNMMHEIEIMVRMDHPNIVTCYDVFDEYIDIQNINNPVPFKSIILIQELMGEGTLKSVIKKNFINGKLILKFSLIAYWLHQIISALNYMHEKISPPIIHRDLKADNCFLESKSSEKYLNVKVGDFGLAKQLGNKEKNTMLGTVGFMAPEVYDEKYDAKVDIYAFGMLMLEVVTNRTPYDECETVMQVAKETMSGKLPEIFNLVHDQGTREVISCCIHPLPAFRPSAMELFYNPIFLNKNEEDKKDMLPVEITPNFDKCIDREAMVYHFVANIVPDSLIYNTKFNLRMDFRDRRVQRSLNLDDGESLEFDLDVYKEEDIPELIANLKSEYEENMREGLNPNKNIEAKQINIQLEKIFKSMECQMQFLLKMIIGKRWFYILEKILSKQIDPDLKDDITGFSLLATYKTNWLKASKELETEITEYGKLVKNDEMKKISKIFKTPDIVQNDSIPDPLPDSIKMERKSQETGIKSSSITSPRPKNDSVETCSYHPPRMSSTLPMSNPPLYYPVNYPQLPNNIPGNFPNNLLFWNPYNPMMYPNPNMTDPMLYYNGNPDILVQQNKRSQTNSKNDRPSIQCGYGNVTNCQKGSINDKPETLIKERLDESADKILTLEEVMKYITSKSHRNSKHPFLIIPVFGQSNAFKIVKVVEHKQTEKKLNEESNESPNLRGSQIRNKSIKNQRTNYDFGSPFLPNNMQGTSSTPMPNFVMGYPQQMYTNPISNFPTFPQFPPMFGSPCGFQNWIQQQTYMQQLQQQQFQQQHQGSVFMQTFTNNDLFNRFSDLLSPHNEKIPAYVSENSEPKPGDNKLDSVHEIFPIEHSQVCDSSHAKFVVKKVEELQSKLSSYEEQTESHFSGGIEDFKIIHTDLKHTPIKSKTSIIKRENDKDLKENNCNLEKNLERRFSKQINSHGEQVDSNNVINTNICQTLSSSNLISNIGELRAIGTSTNEIENHNVEGQDDSINSQITPTNILNSPLLLNLTECLRSAYIKKN